LHSIARGIGIPILIVGVSAVGCGAPGSDTSRIEPVYDNATGQLQLLKYDANGDGTIDTWSYMEGARVMRIELDRDQNRVVDRWEYYGPDQTIEKVGASRTDDGTVDSWAFYDAAGALTKLELATRRNGNVDRIEHYEQGSVVRAEQDTDADGRMDKWETFEGSRLAAVAFDTQHRGTPDRRLVYSTDGGVKLETIP
jgi:hypothetical protein